MLHHLQGLVAGDTLDLLRGTASLIQGRCSVLSEALELDRAKIERGLVTPPASFAGYWTRTPVPDELARLQA